MIPLAQFGRDHWSTLAYIETCCTDNSGRVDRRRMRGNPETHPGLSFLPRWSSQHGTLLADGTRLEAHDDWDCAEDLERAGFLLIRGTGIAPFYVMTRFGLGTAYLLREHRSAGKSYKDFRFSFPENPDRAGWFLRDCESEYLCADAERSVIVFDEYQDAVDLGVGLNEVTAPFEANVLNLMLMLANGDSLIIPKKTAAIYSDRLRANAAVFPAGVRIPKLKMSQFDVRGCVALRIQVKVKPEEKARLQSFFASNAQEESTSARG